ncbi:MAG: formate--tetrahydrofolate ligase, partial [Myxococcales bacterium]|nr:formate--tetrahydrofolate ligase [Myxococcales bacterium]
MAPTPRRGARDAPARGVPLPTGRRARGSRRCDPPGARGGELVRPIREVAADLGVHDDHVLMYGRDKAKIDLAALEGRPSKGKLVLVSAITPTKAGEGKTTTSVALGMGLSHIGENAVICLREPSLGPVFGIKGGGTGGGRAQIEPAAEINLHFTGDIHAITSAHNLLSALVDNDLHFGAPSGLDARRVTWPRVLDMNDRALRDVVIGLGGQNGGVPRETRFDITAAS